VSTGFFRRRGDFFGAISGRWIFDFTGAVAARQAFFIMPKNKSKKTVKVVFSSWYLRYYKDRSPNPATQVAS
jgi:hypothetical protein